MDRLTDDELRDLGDAELVARMDEILTFVPWLATGAETFGLNVRSIFATKAVIEADLRLRRKMIHTAFRFLLQLLYTQAISGGAMSLPRDSEQSGHIQMAVRQQMIIVSSRIAYEYFMHLSQILVTGREVEPVDKSVQKGYRNWLKEPGNHFTYFAITAVRALEFDHDKRTPEVHGGSKIARQPLRLDDFDNGVFDLLKSLENQWQFLLAIADGREPGGWSASGDVSGDRRWYEMWERGDRDEINAEIDRMFTDGV